MKKLPAYSAGLLLFFAAAFSLFNQKAAAASAADLSFETAKGGFKDDEAKIFSLVNQERRRSRLSDLSWNDELAEIARNYSRKMAKENFFSHYDGEGQGIADRINQAKVKNWQKVGENLFYCQDLDDFDESSVKSWMKSAVHKQNILDRSWTESGIGIASSKSGKIYITQIFMRR